VLGAVALGGETDDLPSLFAVQGLVRLQLSEHGNLFFGGELFLGRLEIGDRFDWEGVLVVVAEKEKVVVREVG